MCIQHNICLITGQTLKYYVAVQSYYNYVNNINVLIIVFFITICYTYYSFTIITLI